MEVTCPSVDDDDGVGFAEGVLSKETDRLVCVVTAYWMLLVVRGTVFRGSGTGPRFPITMDPSSYDPSYNGSFDASLNSFERSVGQAVNQWMWVWGRAERFHCEVTFQWC